MSSFGLRWLASGLAASLIVLPVPHFLPRVPPAFDMMLFWVAVAACYVALSWKRGAGARDFALILAPSVVIIMGVLTLLLPGAWAPWF